MCYSVDMENDVQPKRKVGRPSIFSDALAEEICLRLVKGETLSKICKDDHMPNFSVVMDWIKDPNKKKFSNDYAKARLAQANHFFDQLIDIADDASNDWIETSKGLQFNKEAAMRSRLRVDTRKWYISKVLPKVYGDKVDVTTNGKDLPTPILSLSHVRRDDSNEEGHSTD